MKIIAIFNNKGGVGKTTYLYHIANLLADSGKIVLMVDCDSQCNLTAYAMSDKELRDSWSASGNSIYKVIEPIVAGTGDFRKRQPQKLSNNLYIVPGDVDLSNFEDRLGETWNSAANQESSLRTQIAIYRYMLYCSKKTAADFVLVDLGPNLGALNRSVLGGCDYFITPLSPDLFSIKGTENLGNKFAIWSKEWNRNLTSWREDRDAFSEFDLPIAKPCFLGYVTQQHNIRNTITGMTQGWSIFGDKVDLAVRQNIVNKLLPLNQVVVRENYKLSAIPNLHSLIPYSLAARKPVYKCKGTDGLKGGHINSARDSKEYYREIIEVMLSLI